MPTAHRKEPVGCVVVTVSDSRTHQTDKSGPLIRSLFEGKGHRVMATHLVKNDPQAVRDCLEECVGEPLQQLVVFTGGTGISSRDVTVDTLEPLFEKRLSGFGELFRFLSYEEIGPRGWFSRACAGTYKGRLVFAIPGSEGAVRLAMEKLILPELNHLIYELGR
jgi:molybdenum cofactor biosynthesis protein B